MFFIVSKILAFLLNPLIWILVLLGFTLFIKNAKKKKKLLIITIIVLYFFSNHFIISEFYRVWEVQPAQLYQLEDHYDVGVVLSGGMITYDDRYERYTFRANTDRFLQAVYLYKEKKIGKILISGGSGSLIFRDQLEAVSLKDFLVNTLEIPEADILVDSVSDNTHQNAVESTKIINEIFDNPKVLLITSAFHMRRANMCFKKQGIEVALYSTDLTAGPRRYEFEHLFIPAMQSVLQWNKLLHEWIGIIIYKIMGYV